MFKKLTSIALVGLLSLLTCFAQTATMPAADNQSKLTRADFFRTEIIKPDFEKESFKRVKRQNKLSGGAQTALWVGLLAGGIVTVVILAKTLGDDEQTNSPCGVGTSQIGVPCPPGCVCIQ